MTFLSRSLRTAVGFALSIPLIIQAQTIRGTVHDNSTGRPLPGAVVTLFDANGAVLARALTDTGGYRIASGSGAARLQVRKIGFAPVDSAVRGLTRIDVRLSPLPHQLTPVRVVDSERCEARSDRGAALALWNEARSALLASALWQETKAAQSTIDRYERLFPNTTLRVTRSRVRGTGRLLRAARTPTELASLGYRSHSASTEEYFSPDELVLFDDAFAGSHCFSLGKAKDSTIAIVFTPDRTVRQVDVEGEVRFRTRPLDIAGIEFRFTGLERQLARLEPGGFVVYASTPSGVSIATHWQVRTPREILFRHTVGGRDSNGVVHHRLQNVDSLAGLSVTGALIESINWNGAGSWKANLPAIAGIATSGGRPEAGLTVRISGTPYLASTDSGGRFSIPDVLPGRHRLSAGDSVLAAFGVYRFAVQTIDLDSTGTTTLKELKLPSQRTVLTRLCDSTAPNLLKLKGRGGNSTLLGRVAPSGSVTRVTSLRIQQQDAALPFELRTDKDGFFRVCNARVGTTLTIATDHPDVRRETVVEVGKSLEFITIGRP
jgi:hypothetical protein